MKKIKSLFKDRRQTVLWGAILLAGVILGYGIKGGQVTPAVQPSEAGITQETVQEEAKLYACPMACVPPLKEPGKCPVCGMALVGAPAAGENASGLRITQKEMESASIRTAPVERKRVSAQVRLFGRIDYDPAHVTKIASFMPGVIDRVYVKRAGQFVRWGDPLFDISSPDLLETQKQLVEAMKYVPSFMAFQAGMPHAAKEMPVQDLEEPEKSGERSPEAKAALKKIAAIRHKLGILGLPKRDIDELMKVGDATGIATVYSSVYGQIIEQNAYEGSYVNRGTAVFIIGDPRYVWTRLDAYEADYPWLRKGQGVTFWTDAYPGELFEGKVVYIDPVFNIKTRTFSVAAISPDPGGRLKAGMLVRATIHAGLTGEGNVGNDASDLSAAPLVIPASAPLVTGKRAVVYVAVPGEEGSYEGREIVLGPRAADHYVVLGGLKEGDQVVVNGNFKIDSAVQILARSSMMSLPGGRSATEHHHHGGSDVMHEDYQSERMHSRIGGEEGLEPVPGQGMPPRVVRPDTSGTEKSFRPTINRRRPGAYGDTTRSGPETSAAGDPRQRVKREEHRSTTHD